MTTSVNISETATQGRRLNVNGSVIMNVEFKKPADTPGR
jgi:hypothetical protein